jgi:hypothetical protein
MGLAAMRYGQEKNAILTLEGGAEYLWSIFLRSMQE